MRNLSGRFQTFCVRNPICGYRDEQYMWFRVLGFGLKFKHDSVLPLFSERFGKGLKYKHIHIPLTEWRVGYLTIFQ